MSKFSGRRRKDPVFGNPPEAEFKLVGGPHDGGVLTVLLEPAAPDFVYLSDEATGPPYECVLAGDCAGMFRVRYDLDGRVYRYAYTIADDEWAWREENRKSKEKHS